MDLHDVDNTEEFRCISLCSGYAGLELGLDRVIPNLRTVLYVENEAFACTNLVAKIEQGKLAKAPIWTDIKTFDGRPFRDRVHIITAGYPCQGESHAGKRKGTADPRWLWPHIERIIEAVRPLWFFGENVSGHLSLGFPSVYRSLRNLGYSVEAGLFTAAECGAPHRRERLFILAHARSSESRGLSSCQRQENPPIRSTSELADTTTKGLQKPRAERLEQTHHTTFCYWPARPGQPQCEWEEPRAIMGRLNPDWVENLMGIPCNWTNPLYNGTKNKGDSYGDTNQATEKELSVLRKHTGTKEIQGKIGGLQGISEKEVLQSSMLCLRQNSNEAKQGNGEKTSICDKNGKVREVRKQTQSPTPSRGLQSTTKNNSIVPKMSRQSSQSKRNLGENATLRVDRLRLLGNGVVPQCAEKAFRTLIEKF